MPSNAGRAVPEGYVKTSFEIAATAKDDLAEMKVKLGRKFRGQGNRGLSEAAIVEALILTAKKRGVDEDVLARVLKRRKAAQEREG
jgi:hypothetical protein